MKKPLSYHIGNILMLLAVLGLSYIYYPIVRLYFIPENHKITITAQGFYISIPKINAQTRVVESVDPWNQQAYSEALQKGVAQAKGTSLPNESGTVYLFAHSSDVPWRITRYNTAFFRINELKKGDTILLTYNGTNYTYSVFDQKEVWPNDIKYLQETTPNQLILQTCTPIGTAFKRLLIFARKI